VTQPSANSHHARHLGDSAALPPRHPRRARHRSVRLAERPTARRTPVPAPDRPCSVARGFSRRDLRACGSLARQLGAELDDAQRCRRHDKVDRHEATPAAQSQPPRPRGPPGSKQEPGALPTVRQAPCHTASIRSHRARSLVTTAPNQPAKVLWRRTPWGLSMLLRFPTPRGTLGVSRDSGVARV
jgi:hypothetical protein